MIFIIAGLSTINNIHEIIEFFPHPETKNIRKRNWDGRVKLRHINYMFFSQFNLFFLMKEY